MSQQNAPQEASDSRPEKFTDLRSFPWCSGHKIVILEKKAKELQTQIIIQKAAPRQAEYANDSQQVTLQPLLQEVAK